MRGIAVASRSQSLLGGVRSSSRCWTSPFSLRILILIVFLHRTTIPVSPGCLPLGRYDSTLLVKRVDFVIYLSQDDDQRQLLRSHLEARNIALEAICINQTPVYAEYIRWLPQLLAVETKTSEPNGVSAEAQLAILDGRVKE
jgi:hypothetical protein